MGRRIKSMEGVLCNLFNFLGRFGAARGGMAFATCSGLVYLGLVQPTYTRPPGGRGLGRGDIMGLQEVQEVHYHVYRPRLADISDH